MNKPTGICYIVGAMPVEPGLVPSPREGDLVLAADGGYATLTKLGVTPDLVIGDFDSLGHVPDHPNVHRLPCAKDDTDMGYALNLAMERGYTRFILLGGLGGRLDHTVATLQLIVHLSKMGAVGILAGNGQAATAITGRSFSFPDTMRGYCSVFSQGGTARGVTLEGLKYPLENAQLTEDFPLGVSNEFLGVPARVTVKDGTLLLVWELSSQPEQLRSVLLHHFNTDMNG